ncbi:ACT domain-containing protein ACR8-like [Olea europaea var. sylvestris]|uniref:ACT domain-containing protein ACR8-like n=1 Tax=Olea europaea var. sylvestris TaxID=158386 RepID=UPI000C1D0CF9|nr:ACT domain-containing protein ACR8-like [Olea europaea var. sylvestris]
MEWPDEYEKLLFRMSTPSVVIDNTGCANATRVMIDSARKHGILLEAVQVLIDMNLSIKKAYISSDGRWFMDVFHVTDVNGEKITDDSVLKCIEKSLGTIHYGKQKCIEGLTAIELTGADRVGLLSEVFAVLSNFKCNVVEANVWTHNGRVASLIYIKDIDSGSSTEDSNKVDRMEEMLRNVLKGDNDIRSARTLVSMAVTHTERRLHQMMSADGDYERKPIIKTSGDRPVVEVQDSLEKGYSVVHVQCKDRTKLMFDVVCALTDIQYVVFHATVDTSGHRASLEFFIRHTDGTPITSEAEKKHVIQCLRAAIERRASQGVRLELRTADRPGLLADIMRTFRENGINVTRAEILTTTSEALNIFYVTDAFGNPCDSKVIESVRHKIGSNELKVKELPSIYHRRGDEPTLSATASLGSIVRKNLYNLGLINSHS